MPSPDNLTQFASLEEEALWRRFSARATLEWILRVLSVAVLVFLIWEAFHVLRIKPVGWARGVNLRSALASWSTRETPTHAHAVFDSIPTPDLRDWVAALPGSGTRMSWEGVTLKPSAVAVEPVADPKGMSRVWVAAPGGSAVTVRDTLSEIDSVKARYGGAVFTTPHLDGTVRAVVGGTTATTALKDSLVIKPVLVLGVAGWEGKFIMASLEEYGWQVDGQFVIAPRSAGIVTQGPPDVEIDTSHYAAVIVYDSSAAKFIDPVTEFVRQGGGLITVGEASTLSDFSALLPGTSSAKLQDGTFDTDTAHSRRAFGMVALQLKPGAVAVENRDGRIAVAARRLGQGRILQVGYYNTWRWRMGGLETDPVHDFRSWWSAMVSSVAYAPRFPLTVAGTMEPTPMASIVSTLGASKRERAPIVNPLDDPRLLPWLFGILMGALFLEWASRRLRGRA